MMDEGQTKRLLRADMTQTAKLTMLAISGLDAEPGGRVTFDLGEVAASVRVGTRTVQRRLGELESMGWLRRRTPVGWAAQVADTQGLHIVELTPKKGRVE